jgi:hypothetical protein
MIHTPLEGKWQNEPKYARLLLPCSPDGPGKRARVDTGGPDTESHGSARPKCRLRSPLTTPKGVAFEYEVIGRQREPAVERTLWGDLAANIEPRFVCQACGTPGAILRGSEPSLMG